MSYIKRREGTSKISANYLQGITVQSKVTVLMTNITSYLYYLLQKKGFFHSPSDYLVDQASKGYSVIKIYQAGGKSSAVPRELQKMLRKHLEPLLIELFGLVSFKPFRLKFRSKGKKIFLSWIIEQEELPDLPPDDDRVDESLVESLVENLVQKPEVLGKVTKIKLNQRFDLPGTQSGGQQVSKDDIKQFQAWESDLSPFSRMADEQGDISSDLEDEAEGIDWS